LLSNRGDNGEDDADAEGPMVAEISLGAQRSARFAFKRNVEKPWRGYMKKQNARRRSPAKRPN